jgi:hypothetical protein
MGSVTSYPVVGCLFIKDRYRSTPTLYRILKTLPGVCSSPPSSISVSSMVMGIEATLRGAPECLQSRLTTHMRDDAGAPIRI